MNTGILVDATCDLPASIFDRHQVNILPTYVDLKTDKITDFRKPESSNQFYIDHSSSNLHAATSHSASRASFEEQLNDTLLYHYDGLLIVAPHLRLSDTLPQLRESVLQLQPSFEKLRRQAQIKRPFKVRIIESGSAYSGYGLVLYEALRLMSEKARSVDQIKAPLEKFKKNIETFVLLGHQDFNPHLFSAAPFNLNWFSIKKLKFGKRIPVMRVNAEGIASFADVSKQSAENDFFELIYDQITRIDVRNQLINISYAGKLAKLRVLPRFHELHEHIKNKGGRMVHSVMSPTSGTQLGLGAISASFSGKKI